MAIWLIVLLLLFIAVTLYLAALSLTKIEQSIASLSEKIQEYIADSQQDDND